MQTLNVHRENQQNVHIDQTLINSVPVMNNIGSAGHVTDISSALSGQHSQHVLPVQQHSPQAVSNHFNGHQTVPENMLFNGQQIGTSNVHQGSQQNVHIDSTLINSVPVVNDMPSVGHLAESSSTLSGRHSDHIMSVQQNSPQTISTHFNDQQTVPETMLLNAQQIDTPNVQQHTNSHQQSLHNGHIDYSLINSAPVAHDMAYVGYMADASSTLSGRHLDHIMYVQQNLPQTISSHLDVHQPVPETMILNPQVPNNNLELLQAVSQQNVAPSVPLIADTSALNRHLHTTVHHGIGNAHSRSPLSTHNSVLLQQIMNCGHILLNL